MPPASPTLAAWELGRRLKQARTERDMTSAEAAKSIGITQNYMSNVEYGRRTIVEEKLRKLIAAYQLGDSTRDELLALRDQSTGRGWWSRYTSTYPTELLRYLGYEHGAARIRSFENAVMSGLLQSESYARALHRGDKANLRMSEVEQRTEVRMRRKQRLFDDDPLHAQVLLGESVLHQQVGGTGVLAEQLNHLLDLIEQLPGSLDVRVIPFSAGSYGAIGSSTFHLLDFASAYLPPIAWQETAVSMEIIDAAPMVEKYHASYEEAATFALDRERSTRLIRSLVPTG